MIAVNFLVGIIDYLKRMHSLHHGVIALIHRPNTNHGGAPTLDSLAVPVLCEVQNTNSTILQSLKTKPATHHQEQQTLGGNLPGRPVSDELLIAANQEEIPQQPNQTIESQQQQPKKRSMLHGRTFQDTWNASHTNSSHEDGIEVLHTFVPPVEMWLRDVLYKTNLEPVIYKMILSHEPSPIFKTNPLNCVESWLIRNPGYELRYIWYKTIRDYFHPVFLRAFELWRMLARAIFSASPSSTVGWYSDWKEECLESSTLTKSWCLDGVKMLAL